MAISRTAPSGRFIYAFHVAHKGVSAMERSSEALTNMCAEGEMTLGEAKQERIYDPRRRLLGVAITIGA